MSAGIKPEYASQMLLNFATEIESQLYFYSDFMHSLRQFRRFLLLLLSLTLSVQAMAVASLGECHRVKAVASLQASLAPMRAHHGEASAHRDADHGHGKHGAAVAQDNDAGDRPTQEASRVKCAACAACHLCSVVPTTPTVLADIPAGGSVLFPESTVPRVRNVASGLERPPRA